MRLVSFHGYPSEAASSKSAPWPAPAEQMLAESRVVTRQLKPAESHTAEASTRRQIVGNEAVHRTRCPSASQLRAGLGVNMGTNS